MSSLHFAQAPAPKRRSDPPTDRRPTPGDRRSTTTETSASDAATVGPGVDAAAGRPPTEQPATIGDLLTHPVLTIEATETLWDAWQLLSVSGLRRLIVLDDGACVGLIDDRAILCDIPANEARLAARRVGDIVPRVPLVVLRPRHTPTEAAALLTRQGVEALPVVDEDDRILGLCTAADLVRWLAAAADPIGPGHVAGWARCAPVPLAERSER